MALPSEVTALDTYFDEMLFTGAYLSATKGLAALGKKVLDARAKVTASVAGRNVKKDAVVLADVAQAIAWDAVAAPLVSLANHAVGYFDKVPGGYKEVFPLTTKQLLNLPISLRDKTFKPIVALANKRGLPQSMVPAAKEFAVTWAEYATAAAAATTGALELAKAIGAVSLAKRQGVVVMREVEGLLRSKFADNPSEWKKFFRTHSKPKKKTAGAMGATEEKTKAQQTPPGESTPPGETTPPGDASTKNAKAPKPPPEPPKLRG